MKPIGIPVARLSGEKERPSSTSLGIRKIAADTQGERNTLMTRDQNILTRGPDQRSPSSGDASSKVESSNSSTGEGVDRKIEKQTFTPRRVAVVVGAVLLICAVGFGLWTVATGGDELNVERETLTVSKVKQGSFQEFVAVTGTVLPKNTVYLEASKGGRVEEVHAQSGEAVEEGEPLLKLSNSDLRLQLMRSEAQLSEQVSRLQNMRFQIEQNQLDLRQQLAEMDHEIQKLGNDHRRNEQLHNEDMIADEKYQETKNQLEYQKRRRRLTRQAYRQDSLVQAHRLEGMQTSVDRMRQSFRTLQRSLANLNVRAPIGGQLTALDAETGEIISPGDRLGQVDDTSGFKVRAQIDEFYIERIQQGQTAKSEPVGGERREVRVARVYPEVENGKFEVDLQFTGAVPEQIRRGQSLHLRLELGSSEEAVLLARGGFHQSTGGNWAYVLNGEGEAMRQPIELGRQNPNFFEVEGGLQPGDQVVTSSYETFGEADQLSFQ